MNNYQAQEKNEKAETRTCNDFWIYLLCVEQGPIKSAALLSRASFYFCILADYVAYLV